MAVHNALLGAQVKILASSKQSITDATTTSFDFGAGDDIYLPGLTNWDPVTGS